jgi:hypothetical protein
VPAVPEESNEGRGLVPPLKVLRKRLDGVYRAEGFSGPTRRYVLIVALLVGLASLPTLAAITAGSNELDEGTTGAMDVPFLPPASSGPVLPAIPVPVLPAPSTRPGSAGKHQSRSPRSSRTAPSRTPGATDRSPASSPVKPSPDSSSPIKRGESASAPEQPAAPARPIKPARPVKPSKPSPPVKPAQPAAPAAPAKPHEPDELPPPGSRLFCHERGKCGARESRHHRPDWSPHRQSEDSSHRAHWSHHREGRTRQVLVHIRSTGRHSPRTIIREHPVDLRQAIDRHRSKSSTTSHRRSTLTERPHNVRPGQVLERTHNSRRHHAEHPDVPAQSRAYRGSHRAERMHRATENHDNHAAADRSSRVGKHHAERW